jgi:phosphopantothenoylcysteine decarboxylase/phosphopantothenate--cysteine ligase
VSAKALLVGNLGPATFGQDDNALLLVDAGVQSIARASKRVPAQHRPGRLPTVSADVLATGSAI